MADYLDYLMANPDVARSLGNKLTIPQMEAAAKQHFQTYGAGEGRSWGGSAPTAASAYLAANTDVANEYYSNDFASQGVTLNDFATQHYADFGINELRDWPGGAPTGNAPPGSPFVNTLPGGADADNPPQIYNPNNFPTSRQGLDQTYINDLMSVLMPELKGSIGNYRDDVDTLTGQAVGLARNTTQDMMKEMMQSLTSNMNVTGMTDSTVMSDAMGTASSGILSNLSNQVLEAGMEGAKLNLGMPSMLGQLAGLGQTSTSQDPSIPDRILASIYTGSQ